MRHARTPQAKKTLLEAKFVGFYESLNHDFWGLQTAMFDHPNLPNVPWCVFLPPWG